MDAKQVPASPPLDKLLLLLSFTTGMIDAVSVLGLDKVFVANMTGNIVFLGFAIAGAPDFMVAPYLAALGAFLVGALGAGYAGARLRAGPLRHWLLLAAISESSLLWISAYLALDFAVTGHTQQWRLFAIVGLTGFAMGFRNGTVRQLKIADLTTTVLTLTLTGLAADSSWAGGGNTNWVRRVAAVATILAGAFVGATLVLHSGLALPLALTGALIILGTGLFAAHPASRHPHAG